MLTGQDKEMFIAMTHTSMKSFELSWHNSINRVFQAQNYRSIHLRGVRRQFLQTIYTGHVTKYVRNENHVSHSSQITTQQMHLWCSGEAEQNRPVSELSDLVLLHLILLKWFFSSAAGAARKYRLTWGWAKPENKLSLVKMVWTKVLQPHIFSYGDGAEILKFSCEILHKYFPGITFHSDAYIMA